MKRGNTRKHPSSSLTIDDEWDARPLLNTNFKTNTNMKKQLLIFAMILLPLVASAETVEINGIHYNLVTKAKQAKVTSKPSGNYTGSVVIPEKVTYESVEYSVTSIGNNAFYGCSGLTSVTIPNSVTSIGDYAFRYCPGLTSITIGSGVTSIGSSAFSGCSGLTSITIGSGVTSIGSSAFSGCSGLTSITIPNSVTSIGSYAFSYCSGLTSITIPNSVTSIGAGAFEETQWYNDQNDGLIYVGKVAYKYKGNMPDNTEISIREGTVEICGSCFSSCSSLTSVTIPNSVTSIGNNAFSGCI